ncbi:MAG TPA: S41 family peptidase [Tenuifilaceae bacterium]|nr:S41 family peptidase [Tenuifilaceae bacterium]HPI45588.1 S41 family peptidase [Tenuifilaceae bacterium]HPN20340.1 S41 family peptidase [Tenuifilaceae bacterium]
MNKFKFLFLTPIIVLALLSCEKEEDYEVNVNKELYSIMKEYYLWYNQMPAVNPDDFSSPVELMDALRVNPPDKWSYVTTRTELEAYYNQGAYVGFGFGSGFNIYGELFLSFVFNNSPLYAQGINRGWQIISIDGQTPTPENYSSLIGPSEAGVSKTFVFKSPAGTTHEYTFTKAAISMNTVLMDTVYTFDAKKIGYFVLESFISTTKDELTSVFADFKSKGVSELIVDLRYNGGGQVSTSAYLANLIGGSVAFGNIYTKSYHNDKLSRENSYITFNTENNSLQLNKVTFITTQGSASASELLINGLKPFLDVTLVGEKTHGKPVGMYTFTFNDPSIDWAFVPICFTMRNANNEGDYYDGIPVNINAADDITLPFGDVNEASLNAALLNIGVTLPKSSKSLVVKDFKPTVGKGLNAEIGAW